jgi:HEAT repeats
MRSWLLGISFVAALLGGLIPGTALAGAASTSELAKKLNESPDFRVRTQAALALGASANKQAVDPLCSALNDPNTTVRAASGAALGRLALGGRACIEARLQTETTEDVRTVLKRALARLAPPAAPIGPGAKYYVAIGDTTNQTKRATPEISARVRADLVKELAKAPTVALAPEGEKAEQATQILAKHPALVGLFIWPKVTAVYAQGALAMSVELAIFTYPGKAFKGTISKKLTMPDVATVDTTAENDLLQMAAERLAPDLERTASRL